MVVLVLIISIVIWQENEVSVEHFHHVSVRQLVSI